MKNKRDIFLKILQTDNKLNIVAYESTKASVINDTVTFLYWVLATALNVFLLKSVLFAVFIVIGYIALFMHRANKWDTITTDKFSFIQSLCEDLGIEYKRTSKGVSSNES